MSDIVKLLEGAAQMMRTHKAASFEEEWLIEAADTITRLRGLLREAHDALKIPMLMHDLEQAIRVRTTIEQELKP